MRCDNMLKMYLVVVRDSCVRDIMIYKGVINDEVDFQDSKEWYDFFGECILGFCKEYSAEGAIQSISKDIDIPMDNLKAYELA